MSYQHLRRHERATSIWNNHPWYKQNRLRAHQSLAGGAAPNPAHDLLDTAPEQARGRESQR